MAYYKVVEVKIMLCLWSDVYSIYMVSHNPEYSWRVVHHLQLRSAVYITPQTLNNYDIQYFIIRHFYSVLFYIIIQK